jgi:hypothetical protein
MEDMATMVIMEIVARHVEVEFNTEREHATSLHHNTLERIVLE